MKATEQYLVVVLSIKLFKVVLSLESVDEIPSNESSSAVPRGRSV